MSKSFIVFPDVRNILTYISGVLLNQQWILKLGPWLSAFQEYGITLLASRHRSDGTVASLASPGGSGISALADLEGLRNPRCEQARRTSLNRWTKTVVFACFCINVCIGQMFHSPSLSRRFLESTCTRFRSNYIPVCLPMLLSQGSRKLTSIDWSFSPGLSSWDLDSPPCPYHSEIILIVFISSSKFPYPYHPDDPYLVTLSPIIICSNLLAKLRIGIAREMQMDACWHLWMGHPSFKHVELQWLCTFMGTSITYIESTQLHNSHNWSCLFQGCCPEEETGGARPGPVWCFVLGRAGQLVTLRVRRLKLSKKSSWRRRSFGRHPLIAKERYINLYNQSFGGQWSPKSTFKDVHKVKEADGKFASVEEKMKEMEEATKPLLNCQPLGEKSERLFSLQL